MHANSEKEMLRQWLRELSKELGWSITKIAARSGLAPSTLNKFLNDSEHKFALSLTTVTKICQATGAKNPIASLQGNERLNVQAPLISWVQAGAFNVIEDPYPPGGVEEWIMTSYRRATVLALRVEGTSINRIAPPGSIIVYDYEEKTLTDGKLYVLRKGEEATCKRYRANPDRFEPYSLDPDHPTILPTPDLEILGRIVQVITDV